MDVPTGYRFSVTGAGIKYKDRTDMALIYSEREAVVAGTFTSNRVKAAPVVLDIKKVRSGTGRAIVINSGNANACTGQRGMRDAETICRDISKRLDIPEKSVLIASTGIIGTPLPMERVQRGLEDLSRETAGACLEDVARAIMTTDKFPKLSSRKIKIGRTDAILVRCGQRGRHDLSGHGHNALLPADRPGDREKSPQTCVERSNGQDL